MANAIRVLAILTRITAVVCIVTPDLLRRNARLSSTGRTTVVDRIASDHERDEKIYESIPCARSMLESYFGYPNWTTIFAPGLTVEDSDSLRKYLVRLRMSMAFVIVSNWEETVSLDESANALLVLEKPSALENTSNDLTRLCGRSCHFAAILTTLYEDERAFLRDSDSLVSLMWYRSVYNLAIIGFAKEYVLLSTSGPFERNEICAPSAATVLRRCSNDSTLSNDHWKPRENVELNGCTIKTASFDNPPYSFSSNDSLARGIEDLMMQEIVRKLDAGIERESIALTNRSGAQDELGRRLEASAGFDVVFGGLLWNPEGDVDYTLSYDLMPIVWVIPVSPNVSLRGLVTPFTPYVWLAIGLVLLVGGLVKVFLIREISFLDILALVLGVATPRQPTKASSRIQFIAWVVYGFFLTQCYLCQLADQLMGQAGLQIDTIGELVASGMTLGGPARFAALFDEVDEDDDGRTVDTIEDIRRRYIVFEQEEYIEKLADLRAGRNTSLALVAMLNASAWSKEEPGERFHVLRESMGSYPLAIAVWRGLPYLNRIDYLMQTLVQNGLLQYWTRLVLHESSRDRDQEVEAESDNLALEQLAPGFLLLVMGYFVGLLVLVAEILLFPSKLLQ